MTSNNTSNKLFLPPLSSLPTPIYPPSSYPSPSNFELTSLIHPALIIPARRTGQIQHSLNDLTFSERKRKRVYALEEGLDYNANGGHDSLNTRNGYDPTQYRKLVLQRHGFDPGRYSPVQKSDADGSIEGATKDKVWHDARVTSLLEEGGGAGSSSIRASFICLPDTSYSLLTVDQVLRHIMPTKDDTTTAAARSNNGNPLIEEVPSSFEIAGHIAHLNLREEALPYKYLIGKAILDKNQPTITLVVNKIGNIENEYRTFPMEILAGEALDVGLVEKLCATPVPADANAQDVVQHKVGQEHNQLMEAEVKEHGCKFQLDFARVYFNSRLQSEHTRLVQRIVLDASKKKGNTSSTCIVGDVMAGVGPFAIPLTSTSVSHYHTTRVICHANDLNPISYEYLQKNKELNKCYGDRLKMYNLDGREFIHKLNDRGVDVDYFIMNLPQLAPEFLDAFRGWKFNDGSDIGIGGTRANTPDNRPLVHVHCFAEKAKSPEDVARVNKQVQQRFEAALGCPDCFADTSVNEFEVRVVRDVGPKKNMLCVTIRLPAEISQVEKLIIPDSSAGQLKRDRTNL